VAITLFMWGVFLLIVEIELAEIWQDPQSLPGKSVDLDLGFQAIRAELRPAVWLILLLVTVLAMSTLMSRRRRARALLQPQPSPASDDVLSRDLGISEQDLDALRRQKTITLDVDERGMASSRAVYVIVAKQRNT